MLEISYNISRKAPSILKLNSALLSKQWIKELNVSTLNLKIIGRILRAEMNKTKQINGKLISQKLIL